MKRRGLSLVEVIISLSLLALVMVFILNILPTSALAIRQAEHRIQATQLCQSLIAKAAVAPFDQLDPGEHELPTVILEDKVELKPVMKVMAVAGTSPEDPEVLLRVRIIVRWTEARTARTAEEVNRVQEVQQEQWLSSVRR